MASRLFAGITRDFDCGLFLAFGTGGVDIERECDFGLGALLLLREDEAESLIAATGTTSLPQGWRPGAASRMPLRSRGFRNCRRRAEIDLNPIKVLPEGEGCVIVDALIVTTEETAP